MRAAYSRMVDTERKEGRKRHGRQIPIPEGLCTRVLSIVSTIGFGLSDPGKHQHFIVHMTETSEYKSQQTFSAEKSSLKLRRSRTPPFKDG